MERSGARPIFVWSAAYETGLAVVDQQHQELVALLNTLGRAHAAGAGGAELLAIADRLADYAVYHFRTEEALMRELAVQPAHRQGHEQAHADFAAQVVAARQDVQLRAGEAVAPLLTFLSKWLIFHILGVDRRMAAEIRALREGCDAEEAARRAESAMADVSGVLLQAMNGLYEDLAARSHEALEANRRLQVEVAERGRAEQALQARMRELDCLYRCSDVLQQRGYGIEHLLGELLACLVAHWPWGEGARAAIDCPRGRFCSAGGVGGEACLSVALRVEGEDYGRLDLSCRDGAGCAACDGQERRHLLEQIAARVSGYLEQALSQEVRRKLWLAVEQSPVSIVITDRNGRIEYVNPRFCELTGYRREEVAGRTPALLKSGQTPPEVYREMWRSISSGVSWHGELLNRKKGGAEYWEDVTITPVFDASGVLTHFLGIKEDVTAQRAAKAALHASKAGLEQALADLRTRNEQLAELARMSDMIQSCSHENEVMQVIRVSCERLFSPAGGALALRGEPGGAFLVRLGWGEGLRSAQDFLVEDCWALRRGQPHDSLPSAGGPCCEHLLEMPPTGGRCLPLVVAGETLGALLLARPAGADVRALEAWSRLAGDTVDAIKVSLSNFRLREALRAQALRDPLTGLYNRRFFDESLRRSLLRSARSGEACVLALLDIDHFKRFNDSHGHDAGDAVLRAVAACLQRNVRESDLVCRIGGEEIAVLMPGAAQAQAAVRVGMLLDALRRLELSCEGRRLPALTCSAGLAAWGSGMGPEALFKLADEALYEAKRLGRDRLCCHAPL